IWVERNILLRNTIWPRRSYLEILPWPLKEGQDEEEARKLEPGELRIPQGTAPPALRVRAWKYILADAEAPEGGRLLTWADLTDRPNLASWTTVVALPEAWQPRDPSVGMTVDEVELQLEAFPIRTGQGEAKWSVASASEESGWRPLMWADLTKEK